MAHGRRLARLKSILTSYRLVKKQLQLYEDDYMWSVVLSNSSQIPSVHQFMCKLIFKQTEDKVLMMDICTDGHSGGYLTTFFQYSRKNPWVVYIQALKWGK